MSVIIYVHRWEPKSPAKSKSTVQSNTKAQNTPLWGHSWPMCYEGENYTFHSCVYFNRTWSLRPQRWACLCRPLTAYKDRQSRCGVTRCFVTTCCEAHRLLSVSSWASGSFWNQNIPHSDEWVAPDKSNFEMKEHNGNQLLPTCY